MRKARKICCRITPRRVMGAILIAASIVNLLIVGAVYKTAVPDAAPISSSSPTSSRAVVSPPTQILWTPTSLPTQTFTASPTSTFTFTPTETPTSTATNTPSPSPTQCVPQYSWPIYIVQPRDTLYALAPITASSVSELMLANCLSSPLIYVGQRLYVPYLPIPPATITPTYTPVVPTNGPTLFQGAFACYVTIAETTKYGILIQVIPFDLEGINSLVVFYRVNRGSWNRLMMTPSGDYYIASGLLESTPAKDDRVYYIFQATDNVGNVGTSAEQSNDFGECSPIYLRLYNRSF